jgi:diguanylate cyclase (GGDEF)-like protein
MARNLEEFVKQNYKKAIENHEIQVYYQPVIRTYSRKLCSFEALARWNDPERGMIYPDNFIPILEKLRVIHELDAAVLRQVCSGIRSRITNGETPIPVSVNLSRLDFVLCDIFDLADRIVSEYQVPHEYIYFEITESVMADQQEKLKGIIDRFRSAGYQVWMDDFGSAYSSLNVLKELSFDEIKLDMQFLRPFNLRAKRIATAVVEMAKHIDIHTLVEGVETEEHYSYLRNIGCEKVQGYYFGRPMPYEEALARMQEKGIGIEIPQDRQYYDDIGRLDVLSAVPFMTREEHDTGVIARQLNSIPLALAEFEADGFRILFYNSAFEEAAAGAEMLDLVLTQEMLGKPQPYYRLSDKVLNLMDSVKEGGEGRLLFTSKEEYFEVKVRHIAKTRDRFCVIIRLTNLTKDTQSESLGYLDEFLRRIYDVYERITLVDFKEDSIRPLYTSTREDLVSGRRNISKLAVEFAEKYVFPDDRDKYIRLFDRKTTISRLAESGEVSYTELIRSSIRHGRYAWMEYTLLRIDKDKYYLLVRNVQGGVNSFLGNNAVTSGEGQLYSPSHLWNNLLRSGLLRLFWKDEQRRFVGASQAFLDYYGFPSIKAIAGKNDEEVGWHVHPEAYMNDEYQVIHEGATLRFMPGLCMNDGENKEILASKTPLYDDSGDIRGLLGFFIDRDMLNANDRRGAETARRDALTGLLNSRGIAEEAAVFRDEYFLRGADFIRIHIMINDFNAYNEQYGFDFGDKILSALAHALKEGFGLTCAVGRYAGLEFVVLRQVKSGEEIKDLRAKIKAIGDSVSKVDGVPVTLYLSAGFTLFSECPDLEDQTRNSELRLHADHDHSISAKSSLAHASEIFRLFDRLPLAYCVCHVSVAGTVEDGDTIICYVNRKFEETTGTTAEMLFGRQVRELYPEAEEAWFTNIRRAALDGETVEGVLANKPGGEPYRYTASQIICPGYCVVMYQEEK